MKDDIAVTVRVDELATVAFVMSIDEDNVDKSRGSVSDVSARSDVDLSSDVDELESVDRIVLNTLGVTEIVTEMLVFFEFLVNDDREELVETYSVERGVVLRRLAVTVESAKLDSTNASVVDSVDDSELAGVLMRIVGFERLSTVVPAELPGVVAVIETVAVLEMVDEVVTDDVSEVVPNAVLEFVAVEMLDIVAGVVGVIVPVVESELVPVVVPEVVTVVVTVLLTVVVTVVVAVLVGELVTEVVAVDVGDVVAVVRSHRRKLPPDRKAFTASPSTSATSLHSTASPIFIRPLAVQ